MSTLEKKLLALSNAKELSWKQVVNVLKAYDIIVTPPRGGGSHHKILYPGHETIIVPVHNGKIKRIYAKKIAEFLLDVIE